MIQKCLIKQEMFFKNLGDRYWFLAVVVVLLPFLQSYLINSIAAIKTPLVKNYSLEIKYIKFDVVGSLHTPESFHSCGVV